MMKTKQNALNLILLFYLISYILIVYIAYNTSNYIYLITFITIPMVITLYRFLKIYNEQPQKKLSNPFWNYPLDNWKQIKDTYNAPFLSKILYGTQRSTVHASNFLSYNF